MNIASFIRCSAIPYDEQLDIALKQLVELEEELCKHKNALIQNQQLKEQVARLRAELALYKPKLLPCPFCGQDVDVEMAAYIMQWYVCCHEAECAEKMLPCDCFETKEEAIKAWNTRVK